MNGMILVALLYLSYTFSYISRKNIVFLAPHLMTQGFTKADLGATQSMFTACYLISKLSSNIVCMWASPRSILVVGVAAVGVINLIAGLVGLPQYLWVLWGLNGLFSGMCWPPIAKIVVGTFPEHQRGKIWSFMTTSMNLGSTLSPLLVDTLVFYTSWTLTFNSIGVANLILGAILFGTLSTGTSSQRNSDAKNTAISNSDATSDTESWEWGMLFSRYMALLGGANSILIFSVITMSTWGQMFFMETLQCDTLTAGIILSVYEIGGFCGSFISGFVADYVAQTIHTRGSPRSYPAVLCCVIASLSSLSLQLYPNTYSVCQICAFGYGFGTFGAISMIGLMAQEYVSAKFGGILTAALTVSGQIGGFTAGTPLAWLFESHPLRDGFGIVAWVIPVSLICFAGLTITDKRYMKEKSE